MKEISEKDKLDNYGWFNWLSHQWNSYEAFIDFEYGDNPKEVAENFIEMNREEFIQLFESFDNDDLDAIEQLQKLTESEAHIFRIIKEKIHRRNKVKFVDFTKRKILKKDF
tara:strand:+ start:8384 stop:8716 length:333 start_codon:yes stop_codon:yes gene_type:complete